MVISEPASLSTPWLPDPFSTTVFWGCPWVVNAGSPSLGLHIKVKAVGICPGSLCLMRIESEGRDVRLRWRSNQEASLEEVSFLV